MDESRQQAGRPAPEPAAQAPAQTPSPAQAPASTPVQPPAPAEAPAPQPTPAQAPRPATGGADVEVIRRAWPEILQTLTKIKRSSWALVGANAQVAQFDGQLLTLAFSTDGLASAFSRADHAENLRQAILKTIGIDCQITSVVGGNSSGSSEPNPKAPADPAPPVGGGGSPTVSSAVDSAWGLAPAAQSPAVPEADKPEAAPASGSAPSQAVSAAPDPAPAATGASSAAEAASPATAPADPAADYSYSDDDWAPSGRGRSPAGRRTAHGLGAVGVPGLLRHAHGGPAPRPLRHALIPLPPRTSAPPKHLRRKHLQRKIEDPGRSMVQGCRARAGFVGGRHRVQRWFGGFGHLRQP
ncbi:DNA polymerase III subunits gamma and tau [Arthrobacter sp. Hiyo8]|nr:DNA polymerase III subunits gamma and tau [Arthrobacter sp. Hiyo8]